MILLEQHGFWKKTKIELHFSVFAKVKIESSIFSFGQLFRFNFFEFQLGFFGFSATHVVRHSFLKNKVRHETLRNKKY